MGTVIAVMGGLGGDVGAVVHDPGGDIAGFKGAVLQ